MTSSPKRALIPPPAPGGPIPSAASPFPYCEVQVSGGGHAVALTALARAGRAGSESLAQTSAAEALERETRARELGRQQGERDEHAKFEERLALERSGIAKALQEFAGERTAYYLRIEEEAVQLALSIARKILHREAQVDPLLLMGIARVALDQVAGATHITLAVNSLRSAEWRLYLASRLDAKNLPEIVEDAALPPEQCELRTSMGSAALGLEVQFKEIEQGLMDLLAARPQEKP